MPEVFTEHDFHGREMEVLHGRPLQGWGGEIAMSRNTFLTVKAL